MKIFLTIFFISLISINSLHAKYKSNIIVKVENEIITSFEIKNKILSSLILSKQEINQENINKLKKQALEALIQQKLKEIELKKYQFKSDNAQVTSYINKLSSTDVLGLQNRFKDNNLDYELFFREIETTLNWQKFIYKIYASKIEIDEKSVEEELKEIKKSQNEIIKELQISEIEILNAETNDLTQKKIKEISQLIADEGFEAIATKYSISPTASNKGNLGWVNSKSLSKQMYSVLVNMNIGEVSKPIITSNTTLFLKINNKRELKTKLINEDDLKKRIINKRKNELFNLYSNSHLSKLKNTSLIEYK